MKPTLFLFLFGCAPEVAPVDEAMAGGLGVLNYSGETLVYADFTLNDGSMTLLRSGDLEVPDRHAVHLVIPDECGGCIVALSTESQTWVFSPISAWDGERPTLVLE